MDEVNEKKLTLVTRDKQLLAYGRKGHLSVRTLCLRDNSVSSTHRQFVYGPTEPADLLYSPAE